MENKKLKKCIIPIAGHGTRMFPQTQIFPKSFFPIVDSKGKCTPVIHAIIEEALQILDEQDGKVCVIIHSGQKYAVDAYFNSPISPIYQKADPEGVKEMMRIRSKTVFVEQTIQNGFGAAVLCAQDFIGHDDFLVMLGDHIYQSDDIKTCSEQLLEVYNRYGMAVTSLDLCTSESLHVNGIVKGEVTKRQGEFKLTDTAEKPTLEYSRTHGLMYKDNKFLCYFGMDILTPDIFPILEKRLKSLKPGVEMNLRDPMGDLIKTKGMYGVLIKGKRLDTGLPREYAESVFKFARL